MLKQFILKWRVQILSIVMLISGLVLVELLMGRIPICKCGYVSLWYGNTYGTGNSQHLTDWYTFSHVIHGMLFYGFLHLFARKLPVRTRLVIAVLMECLWEIAENSPLVINRYRAATSALDYTGDSVINSVFDVFSVMFGFYLSYKLRTWWIVALIIFFELFTLYKVRDNLTLNIVMLAYPIEAIKTWQLDASFVPDTFK